MKCADVGKRHDLPTFGDSADFGLLLGFVSEAFSEELFREGLFQLRGGLNDPLLHLDRRLHRRKDVRDLLLLVERGVFDLEISNDLLANIWLCPSITMTHQLRPQKHEMVT